MSKRTYSTEEIARRGEAIYKNRVRPSVNEETNRGKFVAIDIESGDYEMGVSRLKVMDRLEQRRPHARGHIWLTRVGLGYAIRFSGRKFEPEEV